MRFIVKLDNPGLSFKIGLNLHAQEKKRSLLRQPKILAECEVLRIDARETLDVELTIPAAQRGWYELPKLKISSTFPLGIFVSWGFFNGARACLVYPAPEGRTDLPNPTTASTSNQTNGGAGDEDFRGLREYVPGEPVKRIAWKTLAKTDELMTKQFSGDGDNQLVLQWQHTANLPDKEKRLSQLCLWVLSASRAQRPYGLLLPDEFIDVGQGEAHQRRCLRALAEF